MRRRKAAPLHCRKKSSKFKARKKSIPALKIGLIMRTSRLVTEGCLRKHLQTRGGERWPGNDCASEMRCAGPAVQAACVPARQPRATGPLFGPTAVDRRLCRKAWRLKGYVHRGPCGANLRNTARGTPWDWRTCGFCLRRAVCATEAASMSRDVEARGSVWAQRASRAPSVLFESGRFGMRLPRGRPN